jgi:hypothetical protein
MKDLTPLSLAEAMGQDGNFLSQLQNAARMDGASREAALDMWISPQLQAFGHQSGSGLKPSDS